MLLRHSSQDVVKDAHMGVAQILSRLDVIAQRTEVVANLNNRNRNADFHNELLPANANRSPAIM